MADLVVIGYLGIGIFCAFAAAKAQRRAVQLLAADPSPAAGAAMWLVVALRRLPWWKRLLIAGLRFPVEATTWPVSQLLEARDRRRRPGHRQRQFRDPGWRGSEAELTPEYASRGIRRRAVTAALVAAALLGIAGAFATAPQDVADVRLLGWILVIGVIARQALDLVDGKFISTLARRSGLPLPVAYRDLVVTAVADLVALTLSAVVLLRWVPGRPVRGAWLREELLVVVKGGHVTQLRQAVTTSPSAVLVALASITFYASLLTPLKVAAGRRRSADDLVAAAANAVRLGRPDRAERLLELGRTKHAPEPAVLRVEGMIAASGGDVLAAWAAARVLVRLLRPRDDPDDLRQREDGLLIVRAWCRELGVTPAPTIVELARDVPVRDSMMAALTGSPGAGRVEALLAAGLTPGAWPLTFSLAYEVDGEPVAAARLLPAADQVTGLDLLWRNQIARVRCTAELGADAGRIQEDARALLADVAGSDIGTWPEWQRSAFARALSLPLLVGGLEADLVAELTAVRTAIAGERAEDAEIEILRSLAVG